MLTLLTSLSDSRIVLSSACRSEMGICVSCLSSMSSPVCSDTSVKSELKPLMEDLVERLKTAKPEETLANCAIDDANCRDEWRLEVLTSSRFDDCFLPAGGGALVVVTVLTLLAHVDLQLVPAGRGEAGAAVGAEIVGEDLPVRAGRGVPDQDEAGPDHQAAVDSSDVLI